MGFNKKNLFILFSLTVILTFSIYLSQPATHFIPRQQKESPFSKAERIDEAFKLERQKTIDPNLGYVPRERLREARKQANQMILLR